MAQFIVDGKALPKQLGPTARVNDASPGRSRPRSGGARRCANGHLDGVR